MRVSRSPVSAGRAFVARAIQSRLVICHRRPFRP
jgi:hypothetical protein